VELLLSVGLAGSYVGLVSSIVLEALEAGVLKSTANAATFSGLMHFIRLLGGEAGVALMTRFITVREQFHSNMLGLNIQGDSWLTDERIGALTARFSSVSSGLDEAYLRAIDVLSQQVKAQAYTLAISDGFIVIGGTVVVYLFMTLFLKPAQISYKDLRKMP
jgi:DHA2 family multidrug resistance protein